MGKSQPELEKTIDANTKMTGYYLTRILKESSWKYFKDQSSTWSRYIFLKRKISSKEIEGKEELKEIFRIENYTELGNWDRARMSQLPTLESCLVHSKCNQLSCNQTFVPVPRTVTLYLLLLLVHTHHIKRKKEAWTSCFIFKAHWSVNYFVIQLDGKALCLLYNSNWAKKNKVLTLWD